jgi:hypothetical protein
MMPNTLFRRAGLLVLVWVLSSEGDAYAGGSSGAQRTDWIEFNGIVLAATTAEQDNPRRRAHAATSSYLLLDHQGSLVLQVLAGQSALPYHRLWLKGAGAMFPRLLTAEQLFLTVHISGLLREYQPGTGIVELVHIEVKPVSAREQIYESRLGE